MTYRSPKYQAIIVDDESPARKNLRYLLEKETDFEIVAECKNGREAVASILDKTPDLVLLDIEMPDFDGFEVIRQLKTEKLPRVVFVTAYSEYAVKAFEVYAIDYILKPPIPKRFAEAIARVRKILESGKGNSRVNYKQLFKDIELHSDKVSIYSPEKKDEPVYLTQFVIDSKSGMKTISTDTVDWIEAADHYAFVHTKGVKYLVQKTMSEIEGQVDPNSFLRIKRNAIVNLKSVTNVRIARFGTMEVSLKDGSKLQTSRLLPSHSRKQLILSVPPPNQ